MGLFRKFKNIIIKQKKGNSIPNQTQDILLDSTNYESSQKLQQQQTRNALKWTIVWISLAGLFAAIVFFNMCYEKMLEFVTAYTHEKSLSVDNMFVFLLVFSINSKYLPTSNSIFNVIVKNKFGDSMKVLINY